MDLTHWHALQNEATALRILLKARRGAHNRLSTDVEKKDKRGRTYWGPPDKPAGGAGAVAGGTHIEQAHSHIDRAVQVLRDGGHHDHADALEKVKGRMGKKPRAKPQPMTEDHVEHLRAQHLGTADDHDREAAAAHERNDKEGRLAHEAAATRHRDAAYHLDARAQHKATAKNFGDEPDSDEALSNPRHHIWGPYKTASASAKRASQSARSGKMIAARGLTSAMVARPSGGED